MCAMQEARRPKRLRICNAISYHQAGPIWGRRVPVPGPPKWPRIPQLRHQYKILDKILKRVHTQLSMGTILAQSQRR